MDSSLYWCSQCSQRLQTQGSSSKTREKRGRCKGCGGLIGNRRDEVERRPTKGTVLNLGGGAYLISLVHILKMLNFREKIKGRQAKPYLCKKKTEILFVTSNSNITDRVLEPLPMTGPKMFLERYFQAHCCPGCGGQLCTRSFHH